MQYKTITLELIQSLPEFHARLVANKTLLSKMTIYATELRDSHLAILEQLRQDAPTTSELQLKSEALEIAIEQLRQNLETQV